MAHHIVLDYDSIGRVAKRFDYKNWKTLWNENAGLQGKRNNPNILFHGIRDPADKSKFLHEPDVVEYKPEDERQEPVQTNTHTTFEAITDQLFLRFRVVDDRFQPLADTTYAMEIGGRSIDPSELTPDADGVISVEIKPDDIIAKLTVTQTPPAESPASTPASSPPPPPAPVSFEVWMQVGCLNPIKDKSPAPDDKFTPGVQQRLNNLGLNAGSVTGVSNAATESAIRRFQKICNITEESGGKPIAGPRTQEWLEKLHDQPGKPPAPADESKPSEASGGSPAPVTPADPVALEAAKRRHEQAVRELNAATREKELAFDTYRKNKTRENFATAHAAELRESAAKSEADRARQDYERMQSGR